MSSFIPDSVILRHTCRDTTPTRQTPFVGLSMPRSRRFIDPASPEQIFVNYTHFFSPGKVLMSSIASTRALLRQHSWRAAASNTVLCKFFPPAPTRLLSIARPSASTALSGAGNASQCRFYASKVKGKQKDRAKEGKAKTKGTNGDEHAAEDAGGRGKRAKGGIDTARLVSGSQRVLGGEDQAEYERTEERMSMAIDWFRREVAGMEARGAGRVTPDVLKPVRVTLPGAFDATPVSLQEIATVGVRDGTTLVVTAFEDSVS